MPPKRKAISKGLRFDIFHRDGYTCQYCGQQPPGVVLHIDHILPVVEGGTNDDTNLITSCAACNIGKGRKLLHKPQRPDVDLVWLEVQQELAELLQYQKAKAKRDAAIDTIVAVLKAVWLDASDITWSPDSMTVRQMLEKYGPRAVEDAFVNVSRKVASGFVSDSGTRWLQYTWGVLRRMEENMNG